MPSFVQPGRGAGGRIFINGLLREGVATFTKAGELLGTTATARGPMCFARGLLVSRSGGQFQYDDVR